MGCGHRPEVPSARGGTTTKSPSRLARPGLDRARLRELDLRHVWHPYTQMQDFAAADFPLIVAAEGRHLIDADGRRYLDGTSSMWLTVHGHREPAIDAAIQAQ